MLQRAFSHLARCPSLAQGAQKQKQYKVASFDLFDTLVYRKYFSRADILLASTDYFYGSVTRQSKLRSIVNGVCSQDLIQMRSETTRRLKQESGVVGHEPELGYVLSEILRELGLTDSDLIEGIVASAVRFELELEKHSLSLTEGALESIQYLKQKGCKIWLISDMYFDQRCIETLLDNFNLLALIDRVFVSAQEGCRKVGGGLFKLALLDSKVEADEVCHIGDSYVADFQWAKKIGINAILLKKQCDDGYGLMDGLGSDAASNLVSNCVSAFTFKLANYAHSNNIKSIFFLERDGIVFKEFLDDMLLQNSLLRSLTEGIEYSTLAINRVLSCMLNIDHDKDLVSTYLKSLISYEQEQIASQDLFNVLELGDVPASLSNIVISADNLSDFEKQLEQEADFYASVVANLKQLKLSTIEYLKQQNCLNDEAVLLVDIGYTGTIIKEISISRDDLHQSKSCITHGLLFAGANGFQQRDTDSLIWAEPLINESQLGGVLGLNMSWLEVWFQSSLKPLSGYVSIDGELQPNNSRLSSTTSKSDTIEVRALRYEPNESTPDVAYLSSQRQHRVINNMLQKFRYPSDKLVDQVEQMPFHNGLDASNNYSMVSNTLNLSDVVFPARFIRLLKSDYWFAGSLQASNVFASKFIISIFEMLIKLRKLTAKS